MCGGTTTFANQGVELQNSEPLLEDPFLNTDLLGYIRLY